MAIDTFRTDPQGRRVIDKGLSSILDYHWNFTAWLAQISDTISSYSVTVDTGSGIVIDSTGITGNRITAVLSGGVKGRLAKVTCYVLTVGGRTDERSIYLNIVPR